MSINYARIRCCCGRWWACGLHGCEICSKDGASTLIIEADTEIGKPVQCAGLISKRAIEESETKDKSFINCEIKGAIVRSPSQELMSQCYEWPQSQYWSFCVSLI